MAPKKVTNVEKPKRKIIVTMVELKKELITKWEKGTRVSDLAVQYGMAKSTISTVLKNREAIKAADVAKGVKSLTTKRLPAVEEMENLLMVSSHEKRLAVHSVSEAIICEKARLLYSDITRNTPGSSAEEFKTSKGWFDNFKKRTGFHSVVRHGEAASSNKGVAEKFVEKFQDLVDREGFIPEQVFSCDETGLFWGKKNTPKRTYITREEKVFSVIISCLHNQYL